MTFALLTFFYVRLWVPFLTCFEFFLFSLSTRVAFSPAPRYSKADDTNCKPHIIHVITLIIRCLYVSLLRANDQQPCLTLALAVGIPRRVHLHEPCVMPYTSSDKTRDGPKRVCEI
jgi:hypothetical protein